MPNLGYKTLGQMAASVGRLINNTSTSKAQKIKEAISRNYEEVAAEYPWPELQRVDTVGLRKSDVSGVKDLESGEAEAPLPWDTYRVKSVYLKSPTACPLVYVSPSEMFERAQNTIDTAGIPQVYTIAGQTAQWARLSADSVLTLICSSTGNNDINDVRIRYRTSSSQLGAYIWEDVEGGTFSGSGVDTASEALSGFPVEAVQIPAGFVGTLTIVDDSANEIVRIDSGEAPNTNSNEHYQTWTRPLMRVWPPPNDDYACSVAWQRKPPALLETADTPEIPCSAILEYRAASEMSTEDEKPQLALLYDQKAERSLQRVFGASQETRRYARPRGGNIMAATGIREDRLRWSWS